jgi:hypothetical protein
VASYRKKGIMFAVINSEALSTLRIVGTIFLLINFSVGVYIFRNCHRFFGRDADIPEDIPAVRKVRVELVAIIWFVLTAVLVFMNIQLWFG